MINCNSYATADEGKQESLFKKVLATITNDYNQMTQHIAVTSDPCGSISSLNHHFPGLETLQKVFPLTIKDSVTVDEIKNGVTLVKLGNDDVLKVSSQDMHPIDGGHIDITYVQDKGFFSSTYKQLRLALKKGEDSSWNLVDVESKKPISSVKFNVHYVGGFKKGVPNGIDSVELN